MSCKDRLQHVAWTSFGTEISDVINHNLKPPFSLQPASLDESPHTCTSTSRPSSRSKSRPTSQSQSRSHSRRMSHGRMTSQCQQEAKIRCPYCEAASQSGFPKYRATRSTFYANGASTDGLPVFNQYGLAATYKYPTLRGRVRTCKLYLDARLSVSVSPYQYTGVWCIAMHHSRATTNCR